MTERRRAIGALAGVALAFGVGYPVTAAALETMTPSAFVTWRLLVAAVCLLVLAFPTRTAVWRDGAIGGALLFGGYHVQTVAVGDAGPGAAAVLSSVLLVVAPALAAALRRAVPGPWIVVSGVLAFAGVVLFTLGERFGPEAGEWTALGSGVVLAGYLVQLSRVVARHALVPLLGVQLLSAGLLSLLAAWAGADLRIPDSSVLPAVIGAAVAATAGPVVVQVWAQAKVGTQTTRLVTSAVPLVAVAASAVLRGERIGVAAWLGAVLVMASGAVAGLDTGDSDMAAAASVSAAR